MADPLDLLTFDEGRDELGLRDSAVEDDAALRSLITAISRMIDDRTGPVVIRSVIEVAAGGHPRVDAAFWPVDSVSRIRESTTLPDDDPPSDPNVPGSVVDGWLTVDTDGFELERWRGEGNWTRWILRRGSNGWGICWPRQVELSYDAGRFADTTSVDPMWKQAAGIALSVLWDRRRPTYQTEVGELGEGAFRWPSFALPNASLELLAREIQSRTGR